MQDITEKGLREPSGTGRVTSQTQLLESKTRYQRAKLCLEQSSGIFRQTDQSTKPGSVREGSTVGLHYNPVGQFYKNRDCTGFGE